MEFGERVARDFLARVTGRTEDKEPSYFKRAKELAPRHHRLDIAILEACPYDKPRQFPRKKDRDRARALAEEGLLEVDPTTHGSTRCFRVTDLGGALLEMYRRKGWITR
jgi:hypothetical protein